MARYAQSLGSPNSSWHATTLRRRLTWSGFRRLLRSTIALGDTRGVQQNRVEYPVRGRPWTEQSMKDLQRVMTQLAVASLAMLFLACSSGGEATPTLPAPTGFDRASLIETRVAKQVQRTPIPTPTTASWIETRVARHPAPQDMQYGIFFHGSSIERRYLIDEGLQERCDVLSETIDEARRAGIPDEAIVVGMLGAWLDSQPFVPYDRIDREVEQWRSRLLKRCGLGWRLEEDTLLSNPAYRRFIGQIDGRKWRDLIIP